MHTYTAPKPGLYKKPVLPIHTKILFQRMRTDGELTKLGSSGKHRLKQQWW